MIRLLNYLFMGFWVLFVFHLVSPIEGFFGDGVFWFGIIMLILHTVELAMVYGKLKSIGRSGVKDVLSVLALGLLFWRPLLKNRP